LSNTKDNSKHYQNLNLLDNLSDKKDYQFLLKDLKCNIKLGISDIRLQYVVQYLQLVVSDILKIKSSIIIVSLLN
jgi:hypothetical protein